MASILMTSLDTGLATEQHVLILSGFPEARLCGDARLEGWSCSSAVLTCLHGDLKFRNSTIFVWTAAAGQAIGGLVFKWGSANQSARLDLT